MDDREKLLDLIIEAKKHDPETAPWSEWLVDYLIAHGVTVQRWIPVAERLPKEDGRYLVAETVYGERFIEVCSFAKDGNAVDKYELGGEKNVWYDYDSEWGYVIATNVTHWMPLPELPKGE